MRLPDAMVMKGQAIRANSLASCYVATQYRAIKYIAAVSPLLLLLVLASIYPAFNRTEIPEWRQLVSLADQALNRGDRYEARRLYLQVDRVAYWRKDWGGLVAAACRINKLDGVNGPSSKALAILFRASTAAELAQSYRGLATVALSLSMLGSNEAASAVLDRIQPNWANDPITSDDLSLIAGCSRSQHLNSM
jgi:hypothetical protein